MNKLSVIIITKDEAKRIKNTLNSVKWADEIIVVDSLSEDETVRAAREFTDKIYLRKFDNFSSQKNFAISKCSNEWIFSIDADEVASEKLKEEIIKTINAPSKYSAYKVRRVNRVFGKILPYAAGNDFPIRLFKKEKAKFVQPIHEFLEVRGQTGILDGELFHNTTADIKAEFDKTEQYTELEARWLLERNIRPYLYKLLFYPVFVFVNIYIINKGILDGFPGLLYALVSARYSFIKYRKARKLSREPKYLEAIIARRFSELSSSFPDKIEEKDKRLNCLINALGSLDGKLILEVGCGKGRFTNIISSKKADCVGIDVSANFISEAKSRNKGAFFIGSATELSFKEKTFDAVYAVEVIEHIADLEKCIKEAARVLKQSGKFIIIDRNILSINNRRLFVPNIIVKKYHELKNDWMYPRGFPYTEKWFFRKMIEKKLKRYFHKVNSKYIISDSEENSPTALIFKSIPVSRHFILWEASLPKR